MIRIHNEFVGGNARVTEQNENEIWIENELRDSPKWFYFAFCVEGAAGRELTFTLQGGRLGYFGPAVSHDLQEWHWLGACDGNSFTYRFGVDENKVYFSHHMLYHPARFLALLDRLGLRAEELCKSPKGRATPCLTFGEGERSIILTARHHACESTGSYVLEGVLEELARAPIAGTRVFCVPFVDYDGVLDGDQGKSRAPHDHNRDYTDSPIYPEVRAIYRYVERFGCNLGFDFHSPWHKGGVNDTIFVVRNLKEKLPEFDAFSSIFEGEITQGAMRYLKENDFPPDTDWNTPCACFSYTMNNRPECRLAFTLESAYFGTEDHAVTQDRLVELGRCFGSAVRKYIDSGAE